MWHTFRKNETFQCGRIWKQKQRRVRFTPGGSLYGDESGTETEIMIEGSFF